MFDDQLWECFLYSVIGISILSLMEIITILNAGLSITAVIAFFFLTDWTKAFIEWKKYHKNEFNLSNEEWKLIEHELI